MTRGLGAALLAALCLVLPSHAFARSGFRGEIDLEGSRASNSGDSLDAAFGEQDHWDQDFMARLMWSGPLSSRLDLDAAYLAEARHGGGVALARLERSSSPVRVIDPAQTALWHWDHTVADHGRTYVAHRLDRLALGYSGPHLVLRVGRQALTWGGGLVFHPMDLFNPFAPNATYTAYKPGSDMLYGQWLFDSGADLQGVVVPRRNPDTGSVAADQTSAGIKWHGFAGKGRQLGLELLLAQDYRAQVLAAGASGAVGGASWTAEIVPARLEGGPTLTSWVANLQYAWSWGGRSVNGYVEYFHNGFGAGGSGRTLDGLPVRLTDRLARGELFTVSREYLAAGVDLQWTPLLLLKPLFLSNLDDGSVLWIGQAVYSVSQNTSVTAGFQWGLGGHGTEYGGLETVPGSGRFATPADRLYARFTWYF